MDETGLATNEAERYGYAPQGQRCYGYRSGIKGKRIGIIGAVCENKPIAPFVFEGGCDKFLFEGWLRQCLLPQLKAGSVLIMDNASWHKGADIEELVEEAGCRILYQAPYSPEDNEAEHLWANLKNYVRPKMTYYYSIHDAIDHFFQKLTL